MAIQPDRSSPYSLGSALTPFPLTLGSVSSWKRFEVDTELTQLTSGASVRDGLAFARDLFIAGGPAHHPLLPFANKMTHLKQIFLINKRLTKWLQLYLLIYEAQGVLLSYSAPR